MNHRMGGLVVALAIVGVSLSGGPARAEPAKPAGEAAAVELKDDNYRVAIYYDPEQVTEEKLGEVLRERRCAGAKLDRGDDAPLTVMNPSVGPGDLVQLRIAAGKNPGITKVELPEGWKLVGDAAGFRDPDGVTCFTVRVAANAKQEKLVVLLHPGEGDPLKAEVEVVRKIGR